MKLAPSSRVKWPRRVCMLSKLGGGHCTLGKSGVVDRETVGGRRASSLSLAGKAGKIRGGGKAARGCGVEVGQKTSHFVFGTS